MPIDPASLGAIASAGSNAMTNLGNILFQGATNKKNREFSEKMYNRQRADALADRDFANQYNSPAEQMKRLKAAGLNPNLAYGSLADTKAEDTRQSSPGPSPNQAPQVDFSGIGNAISQFVSITKTMAETDRIREMIDLYKTQQVNNIVQAGKGKAETQAIYQNIQFKDQINPVHLEAAKQKIEATDLSMWYTIRKDAREQLMNSANLSVAFQKVKNMIAELGKTNAQKDEIRKRIELMDKDGTLKDYDIKLRKLNIFPGDPAYVRFVAGILNGIIDFDATKTENKVKILTGVKPEIPKGSPFEKLFSIFP